MDAFSVLVHCLSRDGQNRRSLAAGLALRNPKQYFRFARREAQPPLQYLRTIACDLAFQQQQYLAVRTCPEQPDVEARLVLIPPSTGYTD